MKNDFNLNISRYISTAVGEEEIDLAGTNAGLVAIEDSIKTAMHKHNNEPQAGCVPRPAASRTAFSVRSQPSSRGCF